MILEVLEGLYAGAMREGEASQERAERPVSPGGKGFVDLSAWRAIAVSGTDAFGWLNDLVSADIDDVAPGRARRALLLGPTGGVLASFTVAVPGGSLVLVQDPLEPRPIDRLLAPYVLSSDVQIEDRTGGFAIFAFPDRDHAPDSPGTTPSVPSALGRGADIVALAEDHDRLAVSFAKSYAPASDKDAEDWRVAAAIPRVGVDTADGDLPVECALGDLVSFEKGCFLGQEAVAKARNLGHPRRLLTPLTSDGSVFAGDDVLAGQERAGTVTSVGRFDGRTAALARVKWEHRGAPLRTSGGAELLRRPLSGG